MPVLYSWAVMFRRLQRQSLKPGHVVQRKWLQKGRDQGYVSVPFSTAVRGVVPEAEVNVCLIGRREMSDAVSQSWQKVIDDVPLFDISGEVSVPGDMDPLEPPWETPLDEPLPSDEEVRAMARDAGGELAARMSLLHEDRDVEELAFRASEHRKAEDEDAKIFRRVVEGLPLELRGEEFRNLVRLTILEALKLLWGMHAASNAVRLRWRLACTEGDADGDEEASQLGLRAYFILAGEGLEFVPRQHVDRAKVSATSSLSSEQLRRMSPDDWAASVTVAGTNVTEALKRVPPGWTTFLKGEAWPEMQGRGAVYRLPQTGKRLFIQADFVRGATPAAEVVATSADQGRPEPEEEPRPAVPAALRWLGPLAGLVAALLELMRNSPPFVAGQQRRRELNEILRAIQKKPGSRGSKYEAEDEIGKLEQRLWMDFGDADEAPVVLVVGGQTETGRVISRKLVTSGYHVVLLKPSGGSDGVNEAQQALATRVQRLTPQGTVLASVPVGPNAQRVSCTAGHYNLPDDMYDAVAGIDKLVICACDDLENSPGSAAASLSGLAVKDLLSCWQLYRTEFSERQKSYSTKVRLFNFARQTDFELWDVERLTPSDMCYGQQRTGWVRNSHGEPLFVGQFYERERESQAQLKSPRLKLNFKRFSGLLVNVYNQAVANRFAWFLRTSDFETTRLQYEFEFGCTASRWHTVRMPFNAFRAVRADGVPLPADEAVDFPLRREDVVQMGIVVRTGPNPQPYRGDALNYFSLTLRHIKVYRIQTEPQVVCLGRAEDGPAPGSSPEGEEEAEEGPRELVFSADEASFDEELRRAEAAAAAEIEALVREAALQKEQDAKSWEQLAAEADDVSQGRPRSPMQAVLESGLAFTLIKVHGLNEHPGGKFPVSIRQASVTEPHLSVRPGGLGSISRGDAAALVVSALTEPTCVNAEISAGEPARGDAHTEADSPGGGGLLASSFEIGSTLEEDVKKYLRQLKPNL